MGLFCEHKWEILSENTLPSRVEIMRKVGVTSQNMGRCDIDQVLVTILACKYCGKIKKYKTITGG